jgi:hypothetical protein
MRMCMCMTLQMCMLHAHVTFGLPIPTRIAHANLLRAAARVI